MKLYQVIFKTYAIPSTVATFYIQAKDKNDAEKKARKKVKSIWDILLIEEIEE